MIAHEGPPRCHETKLPAVNHAFKFCFDDAAPDLIDTARGGVHPDGIWLISWWKVRGSDTRGAAAGRGAHAEL
jgi:hypothetical protein